MEALAAIIEISKTKDPRMKPGDLVKHITDTIPSGRQLFPTQLGLIVGWYDSANGYVEVMWRYFDKTSFAPCHVSKLKIVSKS
jgi:hypothetical protein